MNGFDIPVNNFKHMHLEKILFNLIHVRFDVFKRINLLHCKLYAFIMNNEIKPS